MQIHAGLYKGRRVKTVKNAPYRPTTSSVRKSLFDIIGNLQGKKILDLFAGSGILGFEALSRGAKSVIAFEIDPKISKDRLKIFHNIYDKIKLTKKIDTCKKVVSLNKYKEEFNNFYPLEKTLISSLVFNFELLKDFISFSFKL